MLKNYLKIAFRYCITHKVISIINLIGLATGMCDGWRILLTGPTFLLWMVAVAGFTALLVAYLTINFLAIRAALANPVESLRTE